MSTRNFDPVRDARPALQHGWLQPGEQLVWNPSPTWLSYKVHRRTSDGTLIRHPFWRALGWALISPLLLLSAIRDVLHGFIDGPSEPTPIVFGSQWDCLSARLADAREYRTFWVLTDRRLAMVSADPPGGVPNTTLAQLGDAAKDLGQIITGGKHTLPVEPVWLRTIWQLQPGQYTHAGTVKRWWTSYDRLTFPDGSGIDFPR